LNLSTLPSSPKTISGKIKRAELKKMERDRVNREAKL